MGSVVKRSVLMICGDYMEDYEAMVPFHVLRAFDIDVDCVSLGKVSGDKCLTAVHDYMGRELYTELPGHHFTLNANFADIDATSYAALIIPGGRFTEVLSDDSRVVDIVAEFGQQGKPIATTCHSQLLVVAAGLMKGRKCTAFPSLKCVINFAGGVWMDPEPVTKCVMDGNFISALGWPAHAHLLQLLLQFMGAKIDGHQNKSVLFLCGDYVEDCEINVPFQALGCLGCKVEAISPTKKKGETCVTAIFDDVELGKISSEKSGHYFTVTSDWEAVHVEDYDCIVIPGGRSPEFLVTHEKVIDLVKQFGSMDKVVAAIGQGQWVLAAAGLLTGKRCASGVGMKAIVKAIGGECVDCLGGSLAHGHLLTATGWSALPSFISDLANILGITVAF